MLTLEQRLRAMMREFKTSQIIEAIAALNTEMAHDAAQEGHFRAETGLKHIAYILRDTGKIVNRDERMISNYLKDKRHL